MGIISPHIVDYGERGRSGGGDAEPQYRCFACGETFVWVHRVCPECSGRTRRIDDE